LTVAFDHRYAFIAMWIGWLIYWCVAARDVKNTVRTESLSSRLLHIVPLILAVLLLGAQKVPVALLRERFLPLAEWPFWLGLLITAAGMLLSVWARLHLGRNWSGLVTIKEGHELITSGPYALVRHPIYTGLLMAFLGTAVAIGDWRGLLALAMATVALWRKLRFEERWMRQEFGDAYAAYSRRVAALVPFIL